jgi:hypothetical protein
MNDRSTEPVRNAHPPGWLMHLANPLTRLVVRSPLGRRLDSLAVLSFDGRRSGKHYAVPAMTYDYDGAAVVFTDAGWAWNFEGGAPVAVQRGGHTSTGTALMADAADGAAGLRAVLANVSSPRKIGIAIDDGHVPTDAELASVRAMIRLELDRVEPAG